MKNLFDLLFEYEITDIDTFLDGYIFYSVTPDNKYLFGRSSGFIEKYIERYEDILNCISMLLDWDDDFEYYVRSCMNSCYDTAFIDYDSLKPLFDITIEGNADEVDNSFIRNQFVAIRGTCDHKCSAYPDDYNGYALWKLPSCDGKYVGTTVWTNKYATVSDFLIDIEYWLRYCKGLDVLIVNFGITPDCNIPEERDLNYEEVCFCVLVRGSNIKFVTKADEIKRLYLEYSHKYWCTDYEVEDSINLFCDRSGKHPKFRYLTDAEGAFRLEKPSGSKE